MPTGSENQLKSMDDLHTPSADGNSTFHRHEISEHPGKQWELNSGMSVGIWVTSRDPRFAEVGETCRFWSSGI